MDRIAKVSRKTKETDINVEINIDGNGKSSLDTGIGFLDHMLEQISRHGLFDLTIKAKGDLHIDAHHTVEDIGITLGQAFDKAIGDKLGIRRYGHAYVPLDISGRPGLELNAEFTRSRIGDFDVDLIHEFFQGFINHANITLHIDNLKGENSHHQAESIFKGFGRALRVAVELDEKIKGVMPSTKGSL